MRILICSGESSQLVSLLEPLGASCLAFDSLAAALAAMGDRGDILLLAEQLLDQQDEALLASLAESTVPVLLLALRALNPFQCCPLRV